MKFFFEDAYVQLKYKKKKINKLINNKIGASM